MNANTPPTPAADAAREAALERLHADMAEADLVPTWRDVPKFVSMQPTVTYRPYLWKWDFVLKYLERAGELITPERGAERRSMEHTNPDLKAQFTTAHTIATAIQLVKAGERAPAHRHMAGAIRFAARSRGGDVFTIVEGEPLRMEKNDLLLTPSGSWHEHVNDSDHDIVWLDALDFPLVNLMQASWFEPGHGEVCPPRPEGWGAARQRVGRPTDWGGDVDRKYVVRYPWTEMRAALEGLRGEPGSAHDGVLLAYVNPYDGGPTLPTMSCRAQLLRPHEATLAMRTSAAVVYYVIEGRGWSVIDGQRFDWAAGDVFVVPNWCWREHANATGGDAILFSITDEPTMRALGLWRSRYYADHGGHQPVTGTFTPKQ